MKYVTKKITTYTVEYTFIRDIANPVLEKKTHILFDTWEREARATCKKLGYKFISLSIVDEHTAQYNMRVDTFIKHADLGHHEIKE